MKTFEELQKLDYAKLIEELTVLKKELVKIEFELKTGQNKDSHKRLLFRKQIARANTLLGTMKPKMAETQEKEPLQEAAPKPKTKAKKSVKKTQAKRVSLQQTSESESIIK